MWYFSWVLGLGLAVSFGVLNAMWYELTEQKHRGLGGPAPGRTDLQP
jgi:cyd operon protein YbgT